MQDIHAYELVTIPKTTGTINNSKSTIPHALNYAVHPTIMHD